MNDSKLWYLKQINLFEGISDEEIMAMAHKIHEKTCSKKEMLYTPYEDNTSIFVVKRGEVTLYHSKDGKKLTLDVLKPGSVFGNISFDQQKSDHFAEVTEDAYICIFHVQDFINILQAKPELMVKFIQMMSNRIADYEQRLKGGLLDAKEKVIHHMKILEEKNERSFIFKLTGKKSKVTHEKLAQHTGLSRETVTRVMNELKKEGVI